MKNYLPLIFLSTTAVHAATVIESQSFAINETYGAISGSTQVVDGDYFTASLAAFNPGLGTLESFTLTWTLAGTYTGPLTSPGGGVSSGYNGNFLINGISFSPGGSGGGGNGGGGPGGMVINLPLTAATNPTSFSHTFLVADAGTGYDQAILDAILGTTPVTVEWDTPLTVTGSFDTLSVTANGAASLTYSYVPEPSAVALGMVAMSSAFLRRRR